MSRIVDNGDVTLSAALNEVLPHSSAFDACVGYFNLRGWRLLRDAVGKMQPDTAATRSQVRLLVGMAVSPEEALRRSLEGDEDEPDRSKAIKRADQAVLGFARQLIWGVPTKADEAGLRKLRDDLESGLLQVKFAAREPLHAKLYVAHLAGGLKGYRAVVGSSNFTSAGLGVHGSTSQHLHTVAEQIITRGKEAVQTAFGMRQNLHNKRPATLEKSLVASSQRHRSCLLRHLSTVRIQILPFEPGVAAPKNGILVRRRPLPDVLAG